nr:MAG: minor capsid protein 2 [Bacteriophage sp.]
MSKRLPIQFNDEQLELESSRLADLYHKLAVELFEQMVDRLLERGTTSLTDNPYIWQLEKLNQMHALNEHNLKIISKYTDITEEQLRNVIEGEGLKIYKDTKSQLLEDLNKDPRFDTSHVQKQLEAYIEQASGDIGNLINTTLPNVVNEVYRNIAKETVAKVATGVATPDKAIAETIMKWQEVGFRGFKDRGGKNWRIDNYARTVVKTTTRRVYRQMRTQPADELGIDTFYYSKKATAREACAPLQHHIVTYGEAREEGGYSVLSLADHGYGTPGGCLGINCGHYLTPFVIGINDMPDLGDDVKNITPEDAIRNANAQAKQRALERSIRDSKEKLHIANKLGDKDLIDKYKSKIRTQQGAMRDFLKDKPFLHRDYAREKFFKKNEKPASVEPAGNKSYISVKDKWLSNVDPSKTKVTEMNSWEHNGQKYQVDGKHVVLDYSQREKEVGEWLSKTFGKHVQMAPRVNYPKDIPTPDYLIDGMKFDLKEISGSGKNVFDNASKKAKEQAENIVFDITKTPLAEQEIANRLEEIYKSGRRGLNIAVLKRSDELIDILEPKEK